MKNKLLGVYLELTEKCNLKCIHCYNDSGNSNTEIKFDTLKKLINYLKDNNINSITFSGGEPLLYSHIVELLEYCYKKNMRVNLISNLHFLNDEILNLITKYHTSIQISIDGINEVFNQIRKKGNFELLKKNIDIVYRKGISISFNYVINNLNYFQISDFIKLVNDNWSTAQIGFSFINYVGRALINYKTLNISNEQKEKCIEVVNNYHNNFQNLVKKLEYTTICPFNNTLDTSLNVRVDAYGNVYPCQISSGNEYIIGNIYDNNLIDIINSDKFMSLRKKIQEKSKCNQCVWKNNCGHCCPIEVNENNSYGCYKVKEMNKEIFQSLKKNIIYGIPIRIFEKFEFLIKFKENNMKSHFQIKKFFKSFAGTLKNDPIIIEIDNKNIYFNNKVINYNENNLCIILLKLIENEILKNKYDGIMLHGGLISNEKNENIVILGTTNSGKSTNIYKLLKNNRKLKYGSDDLLYYDFDTKLLYPFPKPIFLREEVDDDVKNYEIIFNENEKRYLYYPENVIEKSVSITKIFILERNKKLKKQIVSMIIGGEKLIEILKNLKESIDITKIKKINDLILTLPIYKIQYYENINIEEE